MSRESVPSVGDGVSDIVSVDVTVRRAVVHGMFVLLNFANASKKDTRHIFTGIDGVLSQKMICFSSVLYRPSY